MQLLRIHPAARFLGNLKILAVSFFGALNLLGILVYLFTKKGYDISDPSSPGFLIFHGFLWVPAMVYLFFEGAAKRSDPLCASLPISTARLWKIQILVVGLSGLSFFIPIYVLTYVINLLLGGFQSRFAEASFLVFSCCTSFILFMLSAVLIQIHERRKATRPASRFHVAWSILAGLLGYKMLEFTLNSGLEVLILVITLTLAVCLVFPRLLPSSYELNEGIDAAVNGSADWNHVSIRRYSKFKMYLLFWSLMTKKRALFWIGPPFVFLFGMMCSNLNDWSIFHSDQQLVYSVFSVYLLLAFFASSLYGLYQIDPLPLGKPTIFRLITFPLFLAFLSGVITAEIMENTIDNPTVLVDYSQNRDGVWKLTTPVERNKWIWGEDIPRVSSPWGETHQAWNHHIVKGFPLRVYSQFQTDEKSSIDFVAFQLSQALSDTYGKSVNWTEIKTKFLELNNNQDVILTQTGKTFLKSFSNLKVPTLIHALPPLAGCTFLIWMLFIRILIAALNSKYSEKTKKIRLWILMGFLLFLHISSLGLAVTDVIPTNTTRGFYIMIASDIASKSFGILFLWSVPLMACALVFRWTQSKFNSVEFTINKGLCL